jgi:hypothetical protein
MIGGPALAAAYLTRAFSGASTPAGSLLARLALDWLVQISIATTSIRLAWKSERRRKTKEKKPRQLKGVVPGRKQSFPKAWHCASLS